MADAVQSSMWSRLYWARSAANWASIAATAAYNRGVEMEEDGDTPQWTVIAGALGSARPAVTIGEPPATDRLTRARPSPSPAELGPCTGLNQLYFEL